MVSSSFNRLDVTVPAISPDTYSLRVSGDNGEDTLNVPVGILLQREIDFNIEDIIDADASSGAFVVKSMDVNRDSFEDIIVANKLSGSIIWYKKLPFGGFDGNETEIAPAGSKIDVNNLVIIDFDNDGDLDIVYSQNNSTGDIGWFENIGIATFSSDVKLVQGTQKLNDLELVDLNADGNLDLLVARENSQIEWYQNNGDQTFSAYQRINSFTSVQEVEASDLDNDGDFDVVALRDGNGFVHLYENLGKGAFS